MKRRGVQHLRYVLEALDRGQANSRDLAAISGLSRRLLEETISAGRRLEFLARVGRSSFVFYTITERGRIALAIWRGMERKRIAAGQNGTVKIIGTIAFHKNGTTIFSSTAHRGTPDAQA